MMGFQNTILALNGCEVLVIYRSKVWETKEKKNNNDGSLIFIFVVSYNFFFGNDLDRINLRTIYKKKQFVYKLQ